jgi:hypothetical protein
MHVPERPAEPPDRCPRSPDDHHVVTLHRYLVLAFTITFRLKGRLLGQLSFAAMDLPERRQERGED